MAVDEISVVTGLRILGFGDVCTSGYVNEFCHLEKNFWLFGSFV